MEFSVAYEKALPWAEGKEATARLMLQPGRARGLFDMAQKALALDGEFWECGVYKGGSARLIAEVLKDRPRTFRLFDTFRGFAGVGPRDRAQAFEGQMFYSENAVQDVKEFVGAEFVKIHPGVIPESFKGLENSKIAFVNLDVDLYKPTREALAFILPRMVKGGVIVVDDYNDPDWPGVTAAINELGVGAFSFHSVDTQARIYL
jgi:O-methyltransferase